MRAHLSVFQFVQSTWLTADLLVPISLEEPGDLQGWEDGIQPTPKLVTPQTVPAASPVRVTDRLCGGVRVLETQEHWPHMRCWPRLDTGKLGGWARTRRCWDTRCAPAQVEFALREPGRHRGRGSVSTVVVTKRSVTKAKTQSHPQGPRKAPLGCEDTWDAAGARGRWPFAGTAVSS